LIADGYYERNSLLLARIRDQALVVASLQAECAATTKKPQQHGSRALQEAEELLNSLVLLSCLRSRGTVQVQWVDGVALEAVVLDVDAASGTAVLIPVGDPVFRWWDGISGMLGLDRATARWVSPRRRHDPPELTAAEVDDAARALSGRLAVAFPGSAAGRGSQEGWAGGWLQAVSDAASLTPSPIYGSSATVSLRNAVATGFAWLREHALRDSQSDDACERHLSAPSQQQQQQQQQHGASPLGSSGHAEAERLHALARDAPWMCPQSGGFAHVSLGLGDPAVTPERDAVSLGDPVQEVSLTQLTMHAESSSVLKETCVALSAGRAVGVGPSGLVPRGPMIPRGAPAREMSVAQAVTTVGSDPATATTHKAGAIATAQGGPSTSIRPRPWTGRFFGEGVLDARCLGAGALPGLALPVDAESAAELDFRLGRYPTPADSHGGVAPANRGGGSAERDGGSAERGGGSAERDGGSAERDCGSAGEGILRQHLPAGWWDEALRDAASLGWCSLETRLSAEPFGDLEVSALSGLFASDATCPRLSLVAQAAATAQRERHQHGEQKHEGRNSRRADSVPLAAGVSPFRGALIPEASTVARQMQLQGWRAQDSRWLQQAGRAELAAPSGNAVEAELILADAELSEKVPSLAGLRLGPSPLLAALPSHRSLLEAEPPLHADTRLLRVESSALAGGPGSAVLSAAGSLAGMVVAGAPGLRDCVERTELGRAVRRAASSPAELVRALSGEPSALKSSAPRLGSAYGLEAVVPVRMMRSSEWSGPSGESLGVSRADKPSGAADGVPESALVIAAVTAGSPAERAGLRVGDCILRAGQADAGSAQTLRWAESQALASGKGGSLPLVVMRGCARPGESDAASRVVLENERR
jgi:hypothetical protein